MSERKKLSDLELEKVDGGLTVNAAMHLHNPVDEYDVGKYQYLYFCRRNSNAFVVYARVIDSYEESRFCGTTARVHKVEILDKTSCTDESGIEILPSLYWKAYEECWFQNGEI